MRRSGSLTLVHAPGAPFLLSFATSHFNMMAFFASPYRILLSHFQLLSPRSPFFSKERRKGSVDPDRRQSREERGGREGEETNIKILHEKRIYFQIEEKKVKRIK